MRERERERERKRERERERERERGERLRLARDDGDLSSIDNRNPNVNNLDTCITSLVLMFHSL